MPVFSRKPFGVNSFSGISSFGPSGGFGPSGSSGGCCCGSIGPCCDCSSVPRQYTISVAGVVNNVNCDRCSIYNGDFTLTFRTSGGELGCVWTDGDGYPGSNDVCCGSLGDDAEQIWLLECDELISGSWILLPSMTCFANGAYYTKLRADWSCLGVNTLTLVTAGDVCTGWPASITLTPV